MNLTMSAKERKRPGPMRRLVAGEISQRLAAEKLAQRDGLRLSKETLRKWMVADGLRKSKPRKVQHRTWRGLTRSCR